MQDSILSLDVATERERLVCTLKNCLDAWNIFANFSINIRQQIMIETLESFTEELKNKYIHMFGVEDRSQ